MTNHPRIHKMQPIHQTHTRLSNKQRTLTTSVIPSRCCDPWYDRGAHMSRTIPNQSSKPRQQADKELERKRSILFAFCLFFFFLKILWPSITLFLLDAAAWCLSKEVDFQSVTWASNWLRTCAEMQVTLPPHFQLSITAERRSRHSAVHWQVSESPLTARRAISFYTCLNLLAHTYTEMHLHSGLVRNYSHHMKGALRVCVFLVQLGLVHMSRSFLNAKKSQKSKVNLGLRMCFENS